MGVSKEHADPFAMQYLQATIGDWIYYPKTKICGLVIGVDKQTSFMQIHVFNTMDLKWVIQSNFGQYKVL